MTQQFGDINQMVIFEELVRDIKDYAQEALASRRNTFFDRTKEDAKKRGLTVQVRGFIEIKVLEPQKGLCFVGIHVSGFPYGANWEHLIEFGIEFLKTESVELLTNEQQVYFQVIEASPLDPTILEAEFAKELIACWNVR